MKPPALALLCCTACAGSGLDSGLDGWCRMPEPLSGALVVEGAVLGDEVPTCGRPTALWIASDSRGTAVYVHGQGVSLEDHFRLEIPGPPPQRATTEGELALGLIALASWTRPLDEGLQSSEQAFSSLRGLSLDHVLVWRAASAPRSRSWVDRFPPGLSCGQCLGEEGGYEPVPCDRVEVLTGDLVAGGGLCSGR